MRDQRDALFFGVDTSNYTTSLACVNTKGELMFSLSRPLPVKDGACGLRQSDALFHHTAALPSLFSEAKERLHGQGPTAIGVSSRPRNQEGSYMPCFLAGVSAATAAAAMSGVPLYQFSHQCGHLMAAIYSSGRYELLEAPFAAFHVSGGTTEFLSVKKIADGFSAEIIGGTKDLNAGQVIDRIGVLLGLHFPCGQALEALMEQNTKPLPPRRIARDGCYINLSGLQNLAEKLYKENGDAAQVADFTLCFIAEALAGICASYEKENGKSRFLFSGGVMSNKRIRSYIEKRFDAAFAAPELSRDNAVGIAVLTRDRYLQGEGGTPNE